MSKVTKKSGFKFEPVYIKGLTLEKPAVLVDAEEYEGMRETLEILHEDPSILKKLKQAEKELAQGKTISWEKLKNDLKIP